MLAKIRQLLDQVTRSSTTIQTATGVGRHFELFIISEIAHELFQRGYRIDLISSDGTPQSSSGDPLIFRQRGGMPSPVPAAISGPDGPTSIMFKSPKTHKEWEIWNGVQFEGRSGGHHEFDIVVVPRHFADAVRSTGGSPFGHGWILIECKHVAQAASPDEARTLIARIYDTTILRSHSSHPIVGQHGQASRVYPPNHHLAGHGKAANDYRARNQAGYLALVRTKGFSRGAIALANGYFIHQHGGVTIGSQELLDFRKSIADWIDANL